jgi:CAAX prenyl protease-like protein
MSSLTSSSSTPTGVGPEPTTSGPAWRPVLILAAVALPTGWLLLGLAVALHLPLDAFVLGTLVLGLVVPALVLTHRESGWPGVQALMRRTLGPPRPLGWLFAALLTIPVLGWLSAAAFGGAQPLTAELVASVGLQFLSSLLIVNVWEEMVWMGFVQARAMAHWGLVRGSLVVAGLFAGIHLPLVFAGGVGVSELASGLGILFGTAVGLRLVFGYLSRWTGPGVLVVAITHASFNVSGSLVQPDVEWIRIVVVTVLAGIGLAVVLISRSRAGAR